MAARKQLPPRTREHARQLQAEFQAAIQLHQNGKVADAEAIYRRLLSRVPSKSPRLLGRLAQARLDRDDPEEAERLAGEALQLEKRDSYLHQIHGVALRRLKRYEEALTSLRRAVELSPEEARYRESLGNVLSDLGRFAEAETAFRHVLACERRNPSALATLALAVRQQGRTEEALALTEEALVIDPDHVSAHMERSMALLTLGRLREGFKEYRWRLRTKEIAPPGLPGEEWHGGSVQDKTLLLYPEQGLGDMIQFARFAPLVAARGAKVILLMRPPLVRLLKTMPAEGVEVVPEGVRYRYDLYAPLMSVPERFDLDLPSIPAPVPYLFAEAERIARWRTQARLDHGFKIGIAWQGKPTSRADVGRSFPVRCFERIAALPGVRLIALQKEHGLDQLIRLPPGMRIEQLGNDFDAGPDAFLDSAAAMASLDLIITSDTAIAHLAGALGRPVWVVLKCGADWRWLKNRDDSPWYPTMRLFRQDKLGDWQSAFAKVERALKHLLGVHSPAQPLIPVSWGELIDKITILEIKAERIKDPAKLHNVLRELRTLVSARDTQPWRRPEAERLSAELKTVNTALWEIEDALRGCEQAGDFGARFVELARRVYITNDRRARLKRALNELLGSEFVEEKSYGIPIEHGLGSVGTVPTGQEPC